MTINNKFNIGDTVWLTTDEDQKQRVITGIMIRKTMLIYQVTCCTDETGHYEYELSATKNYTL